MDGGGILTLILKGDEPAVVERLGTPLPGPGLFVRCGSGGKGSIDHTIATGPREFDRSTTVFPKIVVLRGTPLGPIRPAAAISIVCTSVLC